MQELVRANGIRVSYEVQGNGPWLILSHSLGCGKAMWQPQFDLLARAYRVVRYDTRGHGQTDAPDGPYSLDLLADDVKALCDGLGIARFHFVGLSMGGMIGQTVALRYPELLLSLTLASTTSHYGAAALPFWQTRSQTALSAGMGPLVAPTIERWFSAPFREAQPALIRQIEQWILDTPALGYANACLAIASIDTTARLASLSIPVLVLVGAQDMATPPEMAKLIHAKVPHSRLVVLPSAAHLANIEQVDSFNAALLEFLEACDVAA